MSESNYNEVFEAIKTHLIPKLQYEKSQLEVGHLKEKLINVVEELKKLKLKYEEQKLTIEILQAEKESLEAEKKTFEVKVKEVSLKLKQKTYQYESQKNTCNAPQNIVCVIEKISTGSQTVKEEPPEIGVVNVPSSYSSSKASKRAHSETFLAIENYSTSEQTSNNSAKRCMVEKSAETSLESSLGRLENPQNLQMHRHDADELFESDSDSDSELDEEIEYEIEDIKEFRVLR